MIRNETKKDSPRTFLVGEILLVSSLTTLLRFSQFFIIHTNSNSGDNNRLYQVYTNGETKKNR